LDQGPIYTLRLLMLILPGRRMQLETQNENLAGKSIDAYG